MSDNQKQTIVILWEKTMADNLKLDSGNSFVCAICGDIFEEDATEEDALLELKNNFGEVITINQCVIVCDSCYEKATGIRIKNA